MRVISNITTTIGVSSLGEGGGNEDKEEFVCFLEPIRIYAGAIDYGRYSPCKEIGGALERGEEGLASSVH